jgi:hypothetical protein
MEIPVGGERGYGANEQRELYASTLACRASRLMVALIAYFDLGTIQLDIVTAYLNVDLKLMKPVHVALPRRHAEDYPVGTCWHLLQALYGSRESARLSYTELTKTLREEGFQQVGKDPLPIPTR